MTGSRALRDYQTQTSTANVAGLCTALTSRGRQCQAYALAGSDRCFWHSPDHVRDRAAARSAGGRARHGRSLAPGPPVSLQTPQEALALLERVAGDLGVLENSVSRGRALTAVAVAAVDVWSQAALEERVSALEEAYHAKKAGRRSR